MNRPTPLSSVTPGQIAVFILRNGQWSFWGNFANVADAKSEVSYLSNYLDMTAKVFVKQ